MRMRDQRRPFCFNGSVFFAFAFSETMSFGFETVPLTYCSSFIRSNKYRVSFAASKCHFCERQARTYA